MNRFVGIARKTIKDVGPFQFLPNILLRWEEVAGQGAQDPVTGNYELVSVRRELWASAVPDPRNKTRFIGESGSYRTQWFYKCRAVMPRRLPQLFESGIICEAHWFNAQSIPQSFLWAVTSGALGEVIAVPENAVRLEATASTAIEYRVNAPEDDETTEAVIVAAGNQLMVLGKENIANLRITSGAPGTMQVQIYSGRVTHGQFNVLQADQSWMPEVAEVVGDEFCGSFVERGNG